MLDAAVEIAGAALWSAAGDGWERWAAGGRDQRALSSVLCESVQAGQSHWLYFWCLWMNREQDVFSVASWVGGTLTQSRVKGLW